jgi:hypothetical protein
MGAANAKAAQAPAYESLKIGSDGTATLRLV